MCGAVIVVSAVAAPETAPVPAIATSIPSGDAVRDAAPPLSDVSAPSPAPPLATLSIPVEITSEQPSRPPSIPREAAATPAPTESARPDPALMPDARPRPVNPYLNNTPELRARRLARALVSDLVAYNPQKREQGLRDGTLRQLFRDEIRKSWDEYVEQVGASVAESTPHFQDALNDVLAGGRRVF
ncbi:hypothetical protein tb265_27360 [Gemmatimonadetes bacterium T265]|nr:hypothetical protein tb265_27360 [Gemmatimonadetes bacterium T265]